jgi:hypothetical protein
MSRKQVQFNQSWLVKFALEVATRDVDTNEVTSVMCLFCKHCGRDDDDTDANGVKRKRKRTTNIKYFTCPWRSDYFATHLKNQHMSKWDTYRGLSTKEQTNFFIREEPPEATATQSLVQSEETGEVGIIAQQKCLYAINSEIIEQLMGNLLFDSTAEGTDDDIERTKTNAMKAFVLNEDDEVYVATVKSVLKLNMIVKFIAVGISFRQANRLYQSVKDETGMEMMGSISEGDVASHCRIVCAINLQYLKEMIKTVWAFSIAIDAGNNAGTPYLDLRMRCYFKNNVQNFHLVAIPMRERNTGENLYDLIVATLDVLAPEWRHQLIGVATDGASAMTECAQGICTRLERECNTPIFRICCGAHQFDLVVEKAINRLCSDTFLTMLTAVTGHLRRQSNLQVEMKSTCPTFVPTRWISMGKLLTWLKKKRVRLQEHFDEKRPACRPTREWWFVVSIIQPLVERMEKTFLSLQGNNALVQEQGQEFVDLIHDLSHRCNVKGPLTENEQLEFSQALDENPPHGFLLQQYSVTRNDVFRCIDEVGGYVQREMDLLRMSEADNDKQEIDRIISTVANFSLDIVVGVSKIVAERHPENKECGALPPVLPLDLYNMETRLFTASLQEQRLRLRQRFSQEEIERIDEQFRNLRLAVREENGLRKILEQEQSRSNGSTFETCWRPLLGREYDDLRNYCGGIASVMLGTTSVESDFSIINWTKDTNSRGLTDFSLEAILHCKQFGRLRKLFEE